MHNLQVRTTDKGKRRRFFYRPREEGPMIKVELSYRDGGSNMWSGGNEKRGIQLHMSSVRLEESGGHMMETMSLGDPNSVRLLAAEAARYSDRKMDIAAGILDEVAPELSRLWENDRKAGEAFLTETATRIGAAMPAR